MTAYEWVRLIVWLVGLPIIFVLVRQIFLKLRAIRERDAEVRKEEAANAKNPYAELARMYEVKELMEKAKGKK